MSGDPLSKVVSMPSASSTESEPKVTSHPVDKRATEPVREMTSISGPFSEEEDEDEVEVSCKDL